MANSKIRKNWIYLGIVLISGLCFVTFYIINPTNNNSLIMKYKDSIQSDTIRWSIHNTSRRDTDENYNKRVQRLAVDLKEKIEKLLPVESRNISETCVDQMARDNSCAKDGCLQMQLPNTLTSRVDQLIGPPLLHVSDKYQKIIEDMRNSVPGQFDVIFATASSSNHYLESKAMLSNLHRNVFPHLNNFTLIYYDLGLTDAQRAEISKNYRCHMRRFPFTLFPWVSIMCYNWKPIIISAHLPRSNLLYWVDTSGRFHKDPSRLEESLQLASVQGLLTGAANNKLPYNTVKSMFHYFGDEPCAYHPYTEVTGCNIIFHNEPLIREAVLTPWLACALDRTCMCPYENESEIMKHLACSPVKSIYQYYNCHRFDQSALGIIIRKLFQAKSHYIARSDIDRFLLIKRGDLALTL